MRRWKAVACAALGVAMSAGLALAQDKGSGDKKASEKESQDRAARIREMMSRDDGAPKIGEVAPTFKLKSLDGKHEFDMAKFKGKKPVLLFFGSYT